MIKHILDSIIILLLVTTGLMHMLRIIYVFFKPAFLKKYLFLQNPSKVQLILYYLLVIMVSIYGIIYKIEKF